MKMKFEILFTMTIVFLAFCIGLTYASPTEGTLTKKTGFIDVGKTQLYYEEMGEGHPLIMLHGGLLDRRMWEDQFEVFAQQHRVIRFDVRNHGDSKGVPGTFKHYEDLRKVLYQLSIERATIMGMSLGGRIAIDFAIAYPEPPAIGRLDEIQAPTLAVVGNLDMPGIMEIVDLVIAKVPGAKKVVVPDVAHMVNMEKPEVFNKAVLEFLDKLDL